MKLPQILLLLIVFGIGLNIGMYTFLYLAKDICSSQENTLQIAGKTYECKPLEVVNE